MQELTIDQRFDLLEKAIEEKSICRHTWSTASGKSCLLLKLAPEKRIFEIDSENFTRALPFMPYWNKVLTVCLNDWGTRYRWENLINRYAKVMRSVCLLFDQATWQKLHYTFIVSTLEKITTDKNLPEVCAEVLAELKNNKETSISPQKCAELRDKLSPLCRSMDHKNIFERPVLRCFEEAARTLCDIEGDSELLVSFLQTAMFALSVVIKNEKIEQDKHEGQSRINEHFYEEDACDVIFMWFLDCAELLLSDASAPEAI